MNLIMETQFGSHVYGTSLPTSDLDIKGIFIPEARDILLQKAPRTINRSTKADPNARNTSADVDREYYALHEYMKLLLQGQTVALDLLFTPPEFHYIHYTAGTWPDIQAHRKHWLHKGTSSFVGYCRQQAAKYGIKGSRIAAAKIAHDQLERWDYTKIGATQPEQFVAEAANEFIKIVEINGPHGKPEPHLEVCGRKLPFGISCKDGRAILSRILEQYGERARLAEKNEGVDWKALMHAVRVAREAEELLLSHEISFPRPEAELLLQIRKGELSYREVADIIESGLEAVEAAKVRSTLAEQPNYALADELIALAYANSIGRKIVWNASQFWP